MLSKYLHSRIHVRSDNAHTHIYTVIGGHKIPKHSFEILATGSKNRFVGWNIFSVEHKSDVAELATFTDKEISHVINDIVCYNSSYTQSVLCLLCAIIVSVLL